MRDQDSHWKAKAIVTSASPRLRRLNACQAMKPIAGTPSHQMARLPAS